jgi:hypothetical protein
VTYDYDLTKFRNIACVKTFPDSSRLNIYFGMIFFVNLTGETIAKATSKGTRVFGYRRHLMLKLCIQ